MHCGSKPLAGHSVTSPCSVLPCRLPSCLRRAPADAHVVWPDMRPVDIPEGGELPLVLPPAAYAFDFVLAHSTPEDEPELVTGLYCYAELVIQQVCALTVADVGCTSCSCQ